MLVIGGVMGAKKTAVFCGIIVIMSTVAGICYRWIAGEVCLLTKKEESNEKVR